MITEQQRLERSKHIGSSDIAALFNDENGKSLDPFKTATDVWASKVFEISDNKTTDAQSRGNRHEKAMIQFIEEETGWGVITDPQQLRYVSDKYPIFAANLDGFIPCDEINTPYIMPIIVEAKTTSMGDEYGEPGTDQVPFRVNLQVHHQMLCTGWDKAYVATLRAMFGRLDESIYIIKRDERIVNAIIEKGTWFWNDCVLTKTPPPDSLPGDIDIYKRIVRIPEKYAEVETDLIGEWEKAKEAVKSAEVEKDRLFAAILLQLGDAEGAHIDGERELTYFEQNGRDSLDLTRLKTEWPEIYSQIATPNRHRVARIRKIKRGK